MAEPVIRYISGHDVGSGNTYSVRIIHSASSQQNLTDDVLSFRINRNLGSFLSPLRASTAEIQLDNHDGRYSPGRFPELYKPNLELVIDGIYAVHDVNFQLNSSQLNIDGFTGFTAFRLYTGFIDEYEIDASDTRGVQTITCRDIVKKLATKMITTTPLTRTDVQSVFAIVFSHAGVADYRVDSLGEVFGFYTLSRSTSALSAINGLLSAGGYYGYVAANGDVVIREPFYATAEKTAIASYSHFMGLSYSFNDTSLYNNVRISGATREPSAVGTVAVFTSTKAYGDRVFLWQSGKIRPSGIRADTVELELAYRDYENNQLSPAIGVLTPVESVDYIFTDQAGNVNNGFVTVTVSAGFDTVNVKLFNTNSYNIYNLERLNIKGEPFRLREDFVAETAVASSQVVYGKRELSINAQYLSGYQFAKTYADRVAHMYHDKNPAGNAHVRNSFPSMFALQPGDVVSLVHSLSGVNSKHVLMSLSHSVNAETDGWIHNMNINFELARTKVSSR
jgi:hypothetical protein